MKPYLTQALLFLFVLPFIAHADGLTTNVATPPDFTEMSYGDADKAVNDVLVSVLRKERTVSSQYVSGLVHQLRQGNLTDEKKVLVILLLGWLHPKDTNSIEVLIENIDLKAPHLDPAYDIPRWGPYPAQDALVRIGAPAIDPILHHLPDEGSELRRHLMCEVLKSVEHKETAVNQLKQRLAVESNPPKRANLELSVKELEK